MIDYGPNCNVADDCEPDIPPNRALVKKIAATFSSIEIGHTKVFTSNLVEDLADENKRSGGACREGNCD